MINPKRALQQAIKLLDKARTLEYKAFEYNNDIKAQEEITNLITEIISYIERIIEQGEGTW